MNTNEAKEILQQIAAHHAALSPVQKDAIKTMLKEFNRVNDAWRQTGQSYTRLWLNRDKLKSQINWMRRTGMIWFAKGLSHNGKKHKWAVLCGSDIYGTGVTTDAAIENARKRHPLRRKGGK